MNVEMLSSPMSIGLRYAQKYGIPIDEKEVRCSFGCTSMPAIAEVALSDGCLCFPTAQIQDLCDYHLEESAPGGELVITRIHSVERMGQYLIWRDLTKKLPELEIDSALTEQYLQLIRK